MVNSGAERGVVTSSAMRVTKLFSIVGLLGFAAVGVFSFSVDSPWWARGACCLFVILALIGLWQSLTSSIEYGPVGLRARPYPWRPVDLYWRDVSEFRSLSRGVYAVVRGRRVPVLLLEFGRYRWQVRERDAAARTLEDARVHHQK